MNNITLIIRNEIDKGDYSDVADIGMLKDRFATKLQLRRMTGGHLVWPVWDCVRKSIDWGALFKYICIKDCTLIANEGSYVVAYSDDLDFNIGDRICVEYGKYITVNGKKRQYTDMPDVWAKPIDEAKYLNGWNPSGKYTVLSAHNGFKVGEDIHVSYSSIGISVTYSDDRNRTRSYLNGEIPNIEIKRLVVPMHLSCASDGEYKVVFSTGQYNRGDILLVRHVCSGVEITRKGKATLFSHGFCPNAEVAKVEATNEH